MVAVHCAYNEIFEAGIVTAALDAYEVPEPFAAVFQPVNVYPERVGATDDTVVAEPN
jgi:hypothetical protein